MDPAIMTTVAVADPCAEQAELWMERSDIRSPLPSRCVPFNYWTGEYG